MISLTLPDSSLTVPCPSAIQYNWRSLVKAKFSGINKQKTTNKSFDEGRKYGPHDFVGALLSSLGLQVHVEQVADPEIYVAFTLNKFVEYYLLSRGRMFP